MRARIRVVRWHGRIMRYLIYNETGILGYAVLGDYGSLDEAQAVVEVDRIQLIEMIRESE